MRARAQTKSGHGETGNRKTKKLQAAEASG